jgi:sigma-B regulation protein RsbU (phosphoserine phosphatase)
MEKNIIQNILSNLDEHLGYGIALFDSHSLKLVHTNDRFRVWFSESKKSNELSEVIKEIDITRMQKRLSRQKEYRREKQIQEGHRTRYLNIEVSIIEEEVGLVKVTDGTKEKELEFMMDSYAKLAEKNKKELEIANAKIQAQNNRMLLELEIARQVQMGMLPFDFNPENDSVEFAALLKPAKEVGGDFFDIFYIDDKNLCICLGDVSDKGAGSALFMAATKTLIKSHALNSKSTASIVFRVNNELSKNNIKSMFSTLFVGIFNLTDGTLLYSNCGHCYPLMIDKNMSLKELNELNGPPVGVIGSYSFTEQKINFSPDQTILVYSDGITEAINKDEDFFSVQRLKKVINRAHPPSNPESLIHIVFDEVDAFERETNQSDDITLIALKYKP